MSDQKPGDESDMAGREVRAWLSPNDDAVITALVKRAHLNLGPSGIRTANAHSIPLVIQGSLTDYHARAREWRKYGDDMHTRALNAERELKLYREQFGKLKSGGPEPIPTGVYYSRHSDNFYGARNAIGMGNLFHSTWFDRRYEFPCSAADC